MAVKAMSAKIVGLHANKPLVHVIELLLESARLGKITGLCCVGSSPLPNEGPFFVSCHNDRPVHERNQLQSGLAILQTRLSRYEDDRSDESPPRNDAG